MQTWKTLSRRTVLDGGKFLRVESHTIQLPDGQVIPDWQWIITPDFVNVVAVTEAGAFICFRQTKYAVNGISLAPPAGYKEPGEDPLAAAQRELLEETGYEAPQWVSLGHYAVDGNRGAGFAYFYLALGARRVATIHADDLEEQQLLLLSQTEVEEALSNGEFRVLPWATAMSLAVLWLRQETDCQGLVEVADPTAT